MGRLNTTQRLLLAAGGVLILIFQLYKFSEDGIEGSGWILAIVAGVVLMLPATKLFQSNSYSQKGNASSSQRLNSTSNNSRQLCGRAVQCGQRLHLQLPSMMGLPPLMEPNVDKANSAMMDYWLQYCIAFTGVLSLMAEWKKDAGFPDKTEYRETLRLLAVEMAKSSMAAMKKLAASDQISSVDSVEWACRDISEAEGAMKKFVSRLAANIPDPGSPLVDFLIGKIGVPEKCIERARHELRQFTKDTLIEFSKR